MRLSRTLSTNLALLVAMTAAVARAGNDDEIPIGSEASMTGAAVTATVQDGAAGYYNPAGLANSDRPTLDVAADCYGFRLARSPDLLTSAEGEESPARAIDWVLVPSMVTYTRTIMDKWQASFGVFLPRASDMIFRAELAGDAGARWQVATRYEHSDYNYVLAAATKLHPSLRVGGSLIGVYMASVESLQVGGGLEEGPAFTYARLKDLSLYGLAVGGGAQWDVVDNVVIGASARTPTFAPLRSVDNSELAMVSDQDGETTLQSENSTETLWGAAWTSPARFRLGVAYRLDRGWLSIDGDVATPIVVEYAEDRDWNYNLRAGGVFPVTPNFQVGAGLFTDRSPHRSAPVDFYGGTFGVRVGQDHAVDGARQLTFATTLAARYAYGTGEMQGARVPTDEVDDWGPTGVRVRYHEMSLVIGGTVYF